MASNDVHGQIRPTNRSLTERGADLVNDVLKSTTGWLPARVALAIIAWFGFVNLYMTRINMSVIIVAMVKQNSSSEYSASCLVVANTSKRSTTSSLEDSGAKTPSTVSPHFEAEEDAMEWPESIQGLVLGAFYYGYLMTQILGGRLAEMYGTKYVFGGCILGGGICAILSPAVARLHYGAFIALRIIHGMVQGVSWPAMHACIARWIPPFERSRFIAVVYYGTTLSVAITLPMCAVIIDSSGWPAAFYVTGSLSLIWCVFWYFLMYNYPAQHPRISARELEFIEDSIEKSGTSARRKMRAPAPWRAILTSIPMWAIIIGDIGNDWAIGLFFTQLPTYLKNVLGFSIKANGVVSALPFISRYVGSIVLSAIGEHLLTRGYLTIRNARRLFSTIAMWGPALALIGVIYSGCNWKVIMMLFCIALFLNGAISTSVKVNTSDISPNFSGTLYGITNTTSSVASFLVPVVTGVMIEGQQTLGQWQKVFWICIPMYIVLHIVYFIFCSGDVQPWNYVTLDAEVEYTKESQDEKTVVELTARR